MPLSRTPHRNRSSRPSSRSALPRSGGEPGRQVAARQASMAVPLSKALKPERWWTWSTGCLAARRQPSTPSVARSLLILNPTNSSNDSADAEQRPTGGQKFDRHQRTLATMALGNTNAHYFAGTWAPEFLPWQVIAHMFMHGGLGHIFFNMFALYMFGGQLERLWGRSGFELLHHLRLGRLFLARAVWGLS